MNRRLVFSGVACLFSLIALQFGLFTHKKNTSTSKISHLLVTHKNGIGETEMAQRIQKAAASMDIQCSVLNLSKNSAFQAITKQAAHFFVSSFDPDLIIALEGGDHSFCKAKKYIALTHGSDYYFSQYASLPFTNIADYDGFLVAFPDKGTLKTYFACSDKCCNYMTWYSTCPKTPFKPPSNFELFYCGSNMARTSSGALFKVLFSLLDQKNYLHIFGLKEEWYHTPRSYKGHINHDGESILQTINQKGVVLILHAPDHFDSATPTARVFEAAAASAIIISDRNPFIESNFGESVLYIDTDSPYEMLEQIDRHMTWIKNHPKEAIELARRSHEIFVENFTLEKQLENLLSLHENLQLMKMEEKKTKSTLL